MRIVFANLWMKFDVRTNNCESFFFVFFFVNIVILWKNNVYKTNEKTQKQTYKCWLNSFFAAIVSFKVVYALTM